MSALAIPPTPQHTLLLRACLQDGSFAREAWTDWLRGAADPVRSLGHPTRGARRLLPLLLKARERNDLPMPEQLVTYLRAAYFREGSRYIGYREGLQKALEILRTSNIPFLLLKGAALAETEYDSPALRHCHDVDILVNPADLYRAGDAFKAQGWMPVRLNLRPGHLKLARRSGLTVDLHADLYRLPSFKVSWPALWQCSVEKEIAGMPAHIMTPEDALSHVCVHAATCISRKTMSWVCDAWLLIQNHPDMDWQKIVADSAERNTSFALSITLDYLAAQLAAPVPPACLAKLRDDASRSPPDLELQLRQRLPLLRTVQWAYNIKSPLLTALVYPFHLARELAVAVWQRIRIRNR